MCVRARKKTKIIFFFLQCIVAREIRLLEETRQTIKKNPLTCLTVKLRLVVGKLLFSYSTVLYYRTVTGTLFKLVGLWPSLSLLLVW